MAGANNARTSWTPAEIPNTIAALWAKPFVPAVMLEAQPVAADGKIFVTTAAGLYAINNDTGAEVWTYPTALPLGNAPTYSNGILYVGGFDRRIHAINATNGARLWLSAPADGPFETNPVVAGTRVCAGNKDGWFYCFLATDGTLSWRYQTDAPIRHSAAYASGVFYFGSMDAHAYAVSETGTLAWKSATLPGLGFHSGWPVLHGDKVIFMRSLIEEGLRPEERQAILGASGAPSGLAPGVVGNVAGDWTTGEDTVSIATNPNAGTIPDYLEAHPSRRNMLVLTQSTGAEVTYDLDGDSTTDYAPFLWAYTHSGNMVPPVVSGYDGVLYSRMLNHSSGDIPGAIRHGRSEPAPIDRHPTESRFAE
jgi:outer membrane protein assembly factor BamB